LAAFTQLSSTFSPQIYESAKKLGDILAS
jgi:hypothetical protein